MKTTNCRETKCNERSRSKVKVILKCKMLLHRTGPKAFRGVTPPLSKMKKNDLDL